MTTMAQLVGSDQDERAESMGGTPLMATPQGIIDSILRDDPGKEFAARARRKSMGYQQK
jgi:hypothetical protein